jgi:hypothetical protein
MTVKCPSNCECPYFFQHSLITSDAIRRASDGTRQRIRTVTVVCRECGCWIDRPNCGCPYKCHEEAGTEVFVLAA